MGQSFQNRMTKRPRLDQLSHATATATVKQPNPFRKQTKHVLRRQEYQNPIFRAVKYVKDRPWTSFDLSHEFFSTYRMLPPSHSRYCVYVYECMSMNVTFS